MRCVLALDQGGSKCEAALFRDNGELLSWGCARQVGVSGRSPASTVTAAQQVLNGIAIDELQVITFNNASSVQELGLPASCRLSVCRGNEHDSTLALVGEKCGVVIVAGTGSYVFGINREGREKRLDGLGPVLGDVGSGYQIGHLGLRASVRGVWHPRHATSLTGKMFAVCGQLVDEKNPATVETWPTEPAKGSMHNATGSASPETTPNPFENRLAMMIEFSLRNTDRSVIASLAEIVNAEAMAGDAVAVGILQDTAAQIAEIVRDLLDRLQMGNDPYVMVGTGSVALKSDIYWRHLCALVNEFAPKLALMRSPLPLVAGMGLSRLLQLEGVAPSKVRATLFSSVQNTLKIKGMAA